jgi:hypothetical protein
MVALLTRFLVTIQNSYSSPFHPTYPCSVSNQWFHKFHFIKVHRYIFFPLSVIDSELLYDWRFTANQFVLATSPLRLTATNFIFQLNTCGCSPYVTSSLTRGSVCRLQLLLALASAVVLRPESSGTDDHILLCQIRDSYNLEDQVPVFISPRKRVAPLDPQALGSLFFASYDSQGYSGDIRPCLHTGQYYIVILLKGTLFRCVLTVSVFRLRQKAWSLLPHR